MDLKKFLMKFFGSFFVFYTFGLFFQPEVLKKVVASGVVSFVNLFGREAVRKGLEITVAPVKFHIINSCTGIVSFSIFLALMFATDWISLRKRVIYSLLVLPVFLGWNILRISFSGLLGPYGLFTFSHDFLWILGAVMILAIYAHLVGESE